MLLYICVREREGEREREITSRMYEMNIIKLPPERSVIP